MSSPAYWQLLDKNINWQALIEKYQTPFYIYDGEEIHANLKRYQNHPLNAKIHYAVKSNSNLAILYKMAQWGAGFDVVSQGEILRVLKAGGKAQNIVFSGVGKSDDELLFALEKEIACFNIESEEELLRLLEIAKKTNKKAPISLRVNPNVDAQTHPYISTGLKDNKFGIELYEAEKLYLEIHKHPQLNIQGIACHIGSQITNLDPFAQAFISVKSLADRLSKKSININYLDMGGGLGIEMEDGEKAPKPEALLDLYQNLLQKAPYKIHVEPGRSLIGNQALLISRILTKKTQLEKSFLVIDAAMNDYIRPALYQAKVPVKNLSHSPEEKAQNYDIVGPICETGDTFAKNKKLAAKAGDIIAMGGVGAYGMAMSSQYNSRPRIAELWLEKEQIQLIRNRETWQQLWQNEEIGLKNLCDNV